MFVFDMLSSLLLVALWPPVGKRADLLALLCAVFYCAFVTFSYGVPGQVLYLIPDLCFPLYFAKP